MPSLEESALLVDWSLHGRLRSSKLICSSSLHMQVVPTFEEALQNFKQAVREAPAEDNAAEPAPPAEEGAAQAAVEAGGDPEAQNQAQAVPPAGGEGDAAALLPEQQLIRHAVRALRNPLDRQRMEAMRRHMENNDDINWMDNPLGAQMEAEARDLPKRIHVVGNQLKFAGLKRERSAEEAAIRRRVIFSPLPRLSHFPF